MNSTILSMPASHSRTNLADLRRQLTRHIALLLSLAGVAGAWMLLPGEGFSPITFGLLLLLAATGALVLLAEPRYPLAARLLLVTGPTVTLAMAVTATPVAWLPFTGLLIIVLGAMLFTGSEVAIGLLLLGIGYWSSAGRLDQAMLSALAATAALCAALAWLIRHSLYTALEWAWTSEQQAARLLDEVRLHRGELSRTLKSFELANARLRRVENELVMARQQSDEARRVKEQFAANVSHELRTPLNLILGFSELMYRTPEVYGSFAWPPKLRRDIYQIHRSSQHLLTMIDDILSLSRFEMARFDLHSEPTSLQQLIEGVVDIMRDLFQSTATRLALDVKPDLPTVIIDQTRIRQVLLNLLTNALRLTEGGEVHVRAWSDPDAVTISVTDTGPGISADKLSHLFEEFYQVDLSLRRSRQGAGLGLAISKRFVEMHGGRIWAESVEGHGATFYFTLPLPDRQLPVARPHLERTVDAPLRASQGCVLVIDPDMETTRRLASHLKGWDVIRIPDIEQAAVVAGEEGPRAIIHNRRPGHFDSEDLYAVLPVPVISCCLPSRAWIADTRQVLSCLSKPITREQLLEAVRSVTDVETVLIVDDDRGFCQLVTRHIESAGIPVETLAAYTGEEGLEFMCRQTPDLLLLDLLLPGKNGLEVLMEMAGDATLCKVPVILLTATSYVEDDLSPKDGRIMVSSAAGLQPGETLRGVAALITALEPRHGTHLNSNETSPVT
ncbi:MAG: hybrid sensor histidine kinase/response regulator [Chloroflexota bacterium]|nr:hybrid sensor histidine kinase/response regulator [Chloroflexota bacterium]